MAVTDPVFRATFKGEDCFLIPGLWYHWDETWATPYGPFESEEEARTHLTEYSKQLDSIGFDTID